MMDIQEKIREIAAAPRNSYLDEAKASGRRIIGSLCSYVPVEVIHAAGLIPYRLRAVGSTGTSRGDAYYAPLNCSFVRHCFDRALGGGFDFLDGVVFMNGCDHTRRMYDNWRYAAIGPDFLHMFFVPHVVGANALDEYAASVRTLIRALEKHFSVTITDDNLKESIRQYNEMRGLLQAIEKTRKEKKVPIKGSEMLDIVLAVSALPVDVSISLLREVLGFIQGRDASGDGDLRVFVTAGCIEESGHLKLYEDAGGIIVADNICFGARFYDKRIDESGDPVEALSRSYLRSRLSCPRMMDDFGRRLEEIAGVARDYSVDAVIVEKLKFCDMWGWEIERLRRESKKGVIPPLLAIERELYGGATGQIKTRIQAFFEQIRNRLEIDYRIERSDRTGYYVRK